MPSSGPELRVRDGNAAELYYDKDKLLDNGDRWEHLIAANIAQDAALPLSGSGAS